MEIVESIGVRVLPDVKGFKQKLESELKKINIKFTVDVEVGKIDTAKAQLQLEKFRALVERQNFKVHGAVDVDTKTATAAVNALAKETKSATKGPERLENALQGVSRAALGMGGALTLAGNRAASLSKTTTNVAKKLTLVGSSIAQSVLKMAALAVALNGAIGIVGNLGASLATLAPIVGLLPGIVAVAVSAIAALKIGMIGFGDALKNMGDPEKFAESLKNLSPNAQAAAIAIRDLKGPFDDMRKVVQDHLFDDLGKEIEKTATKALPHLRDGLSEVAGGLNTIAKRVLEFGRANSTLDGLDSIFGSTRGALDNLSKGVQPVLAGLLSIASTAAGMLPDLTSGFAAAAQSFAGWAKGISDSGQLEEWINTAIKGFGNLFEIIGNVFGIINTVLSAGGNGDSGLLGQLAAITGSFKDFLQSTEGLKALNQIFNAIGIVGQGLKPLLFEVGRIITTYLAPAIEKLAPVIATAFATLVPAIEPAGRALAALIPVIGDLANVFTSILGTILKEMGPAIEAIVPPIRDAIKFIGQLFSSDDGARAFRDLFSAIGGIIKGALPFFQEIARVLVIYVAPALAKLGPALGLAINALKPALEPLGRALAALAPLIGVVAGAFANVLGSAIIALAPVIEKLVPPVSKVIELLGKFLGGAIDAVAPLLLTLADVVANVLMGALTAIEPALPVFLDALTKVATLLGGALKDNMPTLIALGEMLGKALLDAVVQLVPLLPSLVTAFVDIMNAVIPLLPEILKLVVTVLPELIKILPDLLPSLLKLSQTWVDLVRDVTPFVTLFVDKVLPLLPKIFDAFDSLWADLKPIFQGLSDTFSGWGDLVIGLLTLDFPKAFEGGKKIFKGGLELIGGIVKLGIDVVMAPFRAIFDGILGLFKKGPEDQKSEMSKGLDDLKNKIGEKAKGFLLDAGKALLNGFIDGIKLMFGPAFNTVTEILGKIRNLFPFSPAKEGPFSGRGYTSFSGQALAEDFAKGIASRGDLAHAAVLDMMTAAQLPFEDTALLSGGDITGIVDHSLSVDAGAARDGVADAVREGFSGVQIQQDPNGQFRVTARGGLDFGRS